MSNITFNSSGGTVSYVYSLRGCKGEKIVDFYSDRTWLRVDDESTAVTISADSLGTDISTRTGTISVFVNDKECTNKKFNVTQNGYTCNCSDLTLGTTPSDWEYNETSSKTVSYTKGADCIDNIIANNTSHFNVSVNYLNNSIIVQPKGENTATTAYVDTITVSYKASGINCSKTFIVRQNPMTCVETSCTCYKVGNGVAYDVPATATSATIVWQYSAITWTTHSDCTISSSMTRTGSASTTVNFSAATCDKNVQSGVTSWSDHKACRNNGCSDNDTAISWTVYQKKPTGCTCTCDDLTIGSSSEVWNANDVGTKEINIESSLCITNISLIGLTHFSATTGSTKLVIKPRSENTEATDINEQLTISYDSNGSGCTKTISLTHLAITCDCNSLEISDAPINIEVDSSTSRTFTTNDCITEVSVSSSDNTIAEVSDNNNELTIIGKKKGKATITISYKSKGTQCSKNFEVNVGCRTINIVANPSSISCSGGTVTFTTN